MSITYLGFGESDQKRWSFPAAYDYQLDSATGPGIQRKSSKGTLYREQYKSQNKND